MTESRTKIERNANVVVALLGVIAAALGALSGYFAVTKSDIVQQRDDVQSDVSTLATQQSTLKEQVARLTRENTDLRQQLEVAAKDSRPPSAAPSDVVTRTLRVPLPDEGSSIGVFLDDGRSATSVAVPTSAIDDRTPPVVRSLSPAMTCHTARRLTRRR
jgi:cell division protein FtsB